MTRSVSYLGPDLVPALSGLDVNDLPHVGSVCGSLVPAALCSCVCVGVRLSHGSAQPASSPPRARSRDHALRGGGGTHGSSPPPSAELLYPTDGM